MSGRICHLLTPVEPPMTHDELVFEALCYRRHTGASLDDIRVYARSREPRKHTQEHDRAVLCRLEAAGTLVRVGGKWYFTRTGSKHAKGSALKPEWRPEDALILLAALYHRDNGSVSLAKIIRTADRINHAIPTLEEAHGGLNRLVAGRLMRVRRDSFTVTDKALELYAKVEATCGHGLLDHLDGLRRILDCPCCGVRLRSVAWSVSLDSATLEEAIKASARMVI